MKKIVSLFSFLFFITLGAVHSSTLEECEGYYDPYVWTDCYGIFDGEKSSYAGEWKNGKMHGQGTFTNADGSKYVGEWDGGDKQGQGTFYHADGRKDVGEFYNGKMNGYAIQYNAEGIIIREGIFKNDEFLYAEIREKRELSSQELPDISNLSKETQSSIRIACSVAKGEGPSSYANCINQQLASIGISPEKKETSSKLSSLPPCPSDQNATFHNCFGTWEWDNGGRYVGEWKKDLQHGQGTYTYANGDEYVGEYKDGKKYGQGIYTFSDGEKYVGGWKNGKEHGKGTYTYANGDKYVGQHKDGKMHGQGTYTFADGNKYVGEYKDNKRHGQGTYTHASGNKYVGEYKDGKLDGQGTYTYANGDKYVGEYHLNKRHGQGTYTYASGNKYTGEWKEDLMNGQGTYNYLADDKYKGDIFIGEYRDGKKHGQGTYTFPDGSKGEGEWKDGKPNGYFIQYNADRTIRREGIFKDGKFLYAETREKKEPSKLDKYKSTCEELGFTPGTEKFGDCVMKLIDKN